MRIFLNSKTVMITRYQQKNLSKTTNILLVSAILIIYCFSLHLLHIHVHVYGCSTLRPPEIFFVTQ